MLGQEAPPLRVSEEGRAFQFISIAARLLQQRNLPDAEFARHTGRYDGLRTCAVERTLDTVQRERRVAHATHQHSRLVRRQCNRGAHGLLDVRDAIIEVVVELPGDQVTSAYA